MQTFLLKGKVIIIITINNVRLWAGSHIFFALHTKDKKNLLIFKNE